MSSFLLTYRAITELYTLSLHDALPIFRHGPILGDDPQHDERPRGEGVPVPSPHLRRSHPDRPRLSSIRGFVDAAPAGRSEEHTSELQSHHDLVCRLLLEKKKNM